MQLAKERCVNAVFKNDKYGGIRLRLLLALKLSSFSIIVPFQLEEILTVDARTILTESISALKHVITPQRGQLLLSMSCNSEHIQPLKFGDSLYRQILSVGQIESLHAYIPTNEV